MIANGIGLLISVGLMASPFVLGTTWYSALVFIGGIVLYSIMLGKLLDIGDLI